MEDFKFPAAQLLQLKEFIKMMKMKPEMVHHPDLDFFKSYLESMGATLPAKSEKSETPKPETKKEETPVEEDVPEEESEESDVELDLSGVIEPDTDDPQAMGDPSKELSEDDFNKFDEKKSEAMGEFSNGEFEKAAQLFTEAILINATSAMPFVKRGTCYLKLKKPNACIRDCDRAIEINPDNAAAHKYRGRAYRLLGNFLEAAKDLRLACKIDFDEQADEWLREVTPNAQKIEQHERKKQMKKEEKELKEKKERIQKAKEAREKAAQEEAARAEAGEGLPGGLGDLFSDPELMEALNDPEIAKAFGEITSNPANLMKYQNNPKVMKVVTKMAQKMGGGGGGGMPGMGGMGGMPGMGGFPGMGGMPGMGSFFGGGGASADSTPPPPPPSGGGKPPSATDDLD